MSEFDRNYYLRRAEEEFDAADCAGNETASLAHRILAERYRALAHEFSRSEASVQDGSSFPAL